MHTFSWKDDHGREWVVISNGDMIGEAIVRSFDSADRVTGEARIPGKLFEACVLVPPCRRNHPVHRAPAETRVTARPNVPVLYPEVLLAGAHDPMIGVLPCLWQPEYLADVAEQPNRKIGPVRSGPKSCAMIGVADTEPREGLHPPRHLLAACFNLLLRCVRSVRRLVEPAGEVEIKLIADTQYIVFADPVFALDFSTEPESAGMLIWELRV